MTLLVLAVGQVALLVGESQRLFAFAKPTELLRGCDDVPEAVELARTLELRGLRIEHYIEDLERRKQEISDAEASLTKRLTELRAAQRSARTAVQGHQQDVGADVERLISVYDQMKPDQAAAVLSNLPPEFAAEILMRVQPETSARIMAAVDPAQAALFTTFMGARRVDTPEAADRVAAQ